MNKHQKQFAIIILLAMAVFYFVGEGLEERFGSDSFLISGLLAVVVLGGVPFIFKQLSKRK